MIRKVKDEQGNTFMEISRRAWLIACCAAFGLFFILASYFLHLCAVGNWVHDLRTSLEKDVEEMEASNFRLEAKITSSTPVLSKKTFAEKFKDHGRSAHRNTQTNYSRALSFDSNSVKKISPDSASYFNNSLPADKKSRGETASATKDHQLLRLSQTVGIGIILFTLIGVSVILVLRVLIYIFPSARTILPLYATKLLQVFFGKSA